MIGQFESGTKLKSKNDNAIFETIPLHEAETGLFVSTTQIWEVSGYNDKLGLYIIICRNAGIALKLSAEDIANLFEVID